MGLLNSAYPSKTVTKQVLKKEPELKIVTTYAHNVHKYEETKKEQLVNIVLNGFFMNDTFYKTHAEVLKTMKDLIQHLVKHGQTDFLFNLALFARRDIGMRTMPMVLLVHTLESIHKEKLSASVGTYQRIAKVFYRVDDMTEIMAYAISVFGSIKKVPKVLSKAIAIKFNDWDAYQLGKYNREGAVNLKFLILHSHPKPKDVAQAKLFKAILEGNLEAPKTHEVEFSRNGQDKAKQDLDIWLDLLETGKLPYMASLKSLVRISEAAHTYSGQSAKKIKLINGVADLISNEQAVKKSRQLPYAYLLAASMLANSNGNQKLIDAVKKALEFSVNNIPDIGSNVWILVDTSGSMTSALNAKTRVNRVDVAALFGAIVSKAVKAHGGKACVTAFATAAKHINFHDEQDMIERARTIANANVGHGTSLQAAINIKDQIGFEPKTIIVFSDMQVNGLGSSAFSFVHADCKKIAFDLAVNGTTPLHSAHGWKQLGGYSDSIFKFLENSKNVKSLTSQLSTSTYS